MIPSSQQSDPTIGSRPGIPSRARAYVRLVGFWAISRAVLAVAMYVALSLLPTKSSIEAWDVHWDRDGFLPRPLPTGDSTRVWDAYPGNNWLNGWVRWDAAWYAIIADSGYEAPRSFEPGQQRSTRFFPLFPLLIRAVSRLTGDSFASGLLVSNLALLLALLVLNAMVGQSHGESVARRTIALVLLHPFSFFFSSAYSESLFLLLAVMAFYLGTRRKWLLAALCAAGAGATRVAGFTVTVGLILLYLEQLSFNWRRIRADVLWILLGLVGPLAYMGFLKSRYGSPFEFIASQNAVDPLGMALLPCGPSSLVNFLVIPVLLGLSVVAWRKYSKSLAVWTVLMLLVSYAKWPGMGRFSLTMFPAIVAAAIVLSDRRLFYPVLAISAAMLLFNAARFALWYYPG